MHNVTSNQLLLHLFDEDNRSDSLTLRQMFVENNDLREEFEGYKETLYALKTCSLEPDDHIVNTILAAFRKEKNNPVV